MAMITYTAPAGYRGLVQTEFGNYRVGSDGTFQGDSRLVNVLRAAGFTSVGYVPLFGNTPDLVQMTIPAGGSPTLQSNGITLHALSDQIMVPRDAIPSLSSVGYLAGAAVSGGMALTSTSVLTTANTLQVVSSVSGVPAGARPTLVGLPGLVLIGSISAGWSLSVSSRQRLSPGVIVGTLYCPGVPALPIMITVSQPSVGPTPTPSPTLTVTLSPVSGAVGTVFSVAESVSNGSITGRSYLLDGAVLPGQSGVTVQPNAAGSLVCRSVANGPGGTTVTVSAAVTITAAPSGPIAYIFMEGGNSHGGGRALKTGNEPAWDPRVYQYTQAGALEQMSSTSRMTLDQIPGGSFVPSTQISPFYWLAADLVASGIPGQPALGAGDRIIVVPGNKNATALLAAAEWDPSSAATPNLLGTWVSRANAARAAAIAAGFTPVLVAATFHAADPDYTSSDFWDLHQQKMDAMIDYVRANVTGASATTPVLIGSGMCLGQLGSQGTQGVPYQANYMGVAHRRANIALLDTNNPRYGYSTGIPMQMLADNVHEDYAGVQGLGRLRYLGISRAIANVKPRKPFENLSFRADLHGLYDFRTGSTIDWSPGGARPLARQVAGGTAQVPQAVYEPTIDDYVYRRTNSAGQTYLASAPLTQSYTKLWFGTSSFASAQAFLADTDAGGVAANAHRFAYSSTGGTIVASHGTPTSQVSATLALMGLSADTFGLVGVDYNATTQTMRLIGADGTVKATATGVPPHTAVSTGYICANNSAGTTGLLGKCAVVAVANRVLTQAEVQEFLAACQAMSTSSAGNA